jgi:hypothetical protein
MNYLAISKINFENAVNKDIKELEINNLELRIKN